MNKDLLTTVLWNDGFVAVYSYAIAPEKNATVIVVETFTQDIATELKALCWESEQVIVLSRNDLEYGDDVYSVPLLHMQVRWVCEWGEDLLSSMHITSKELRPHLEWMMRHVLIDLREAIVRKSPSQDVKLWMGAQYDRILCGCARYLWMETWFVRADMEKLILEEWWISCTQLWAMIDSPKSTSDRMIKAHIVLLELVEKVDGL